MVRVKALADGFDTILSEYQRVSSAHDSDHLWMDWHSDWDHGANWQALPVYASERLVRMEYGKDVDWESLTSIMSDMWPDTWGVVFGALDPDRVSLVTFSRLGPFQELGPHSHENPGHHVFHMGMEIPDGDVGIRTSGGVFAWEKPGDFLLFDDNKTHSAWNRTSGDRVVFYVDYIS